MATLKCKMCGGDLQISEGMTVAECEYCGTRQTVPNVDNEKKLTLFSRANRLRMACEFDKAAGVYESIVAEFPEEAEAYWGLVLCRYGIEYVDDPATGKKIPTCHRSSFDSILEDSDFEQACENADAVARRVYREEAKTIEDIRRGIIEVSGKEVPYDIFICYKETDENGDRTIDSAIAQDVYDALTEKGYRVFFSRITLEDKLGQEYEPYIFAALNSAKIMLAFGTDYEYFNAVWVKNEWSRFLKLMAADKSKHLIPCYKGIDAYDMPKEFAKLQAQDMGKVGAIQDLLRGIEKILPHKSNITVTGPNLESNAGALVMRGQFALEDGDFPKAAEYFERALDQNPQDGNAYLGKVLAALHLSDAAQIDDHPVKIHDDKNFDRAIRFSDPATSKVLAEIRERAHRKYLIKCFAVGLREIQKVKKTTITQEHQQKKRQQFVEIFCQWRSRYAPVQNVVAAGDCHTVGLKSDGTVVAVGRNEDISGNYIGCCDVSDWTDIVAISAGDKHTVGLKSDGTVVAVGDNYHGRCDVSGWMDIVAVSAGQWHSVGLRSDGAVVTAGGWHDVSDWTDIVAISAGDDHTVGLKSDGTVVAVGINTYGQCRVDDWTDIVAISAGDCHTVGLKSDGTVVAVGNNKHGQCKVSDWTDIVAISAGDDHTVGLKSDGTVVAVGWTLYGKCKVYDWTDIVAICAGDDHTVALKSDGTVVAVGKSSEGQCGVSDWKLFNSMDTLEQERTDARKRAEEERRRIAEEKARRRAELESEKASLQAELANLKGLFTGKRRREIESRLTEIGTELKNL